ncbi:MAG: hypothetical protein IT381_24820 [Deltaproteobacteria bacterium]|nr:hypothetical protein [Deltaproteobacteria bacterium]
MKTTKWIATRDLADKRNSKAKVQIRLGYPKQLKNGEWRCSYMLKGVGTGKMLQAAGVDGLQSLMNAIEGIATALRESGRTLTWHGGDVGIRRQIPWFLGAEFADRIERTIESSIEEFIQQKKKRLENKSLHE